MAEIDARVRLSNSQQTEIQPWLNFYQRNKKSDRSHKLRAVIESFVNYRSSTLESILSEKGLEVCHFADIHSFSAPPENWELSDKEWRLGLFPKKDERMLFRASIVSSYGGNPKVEILHPELITLCSEHYPSPFDIKTSVSRQEADGWHKSLQSGVARVGGMLHPKADLRIDINEQSAIRWRPESVYQYFGFLPLPPNLPV